MSESMSAWSERPWTALYPGGEDIQFDAGVDNMLAAWIRTVSSFPSSPGVYYFDGVLTFSELDAAADSLAVGLTAGGLSEGDRVAIYLQNDPQWLVATIAAWKCGATAVAVNPMLRAQELVHHLVDSSPTLLICLDTLYRDVVTGIRDDLHVKTVVTTHPTDLIEPGEAGAVAERWERKLYFDDTIDLGELVHRHYGERPEARIVSPDAVALLTYTSGTTGQAKGAMNIHSGMVHSAKVFAELFELDHEDVVLGVAPLFHITGSVAGMGVTILTGAPLVLLHRFDAAEVLRAIEKRRTTFTIAANTAYVALGAHQDLSRFDVSSLVKAGSGGAPVSNAVVNRIRESTGWLLRGVYGMTETTSPSHISPASATPPIDPDSGALAVGVPVPGASVRICDSETGEPLGVNKVGEIVVSGPMVIPGYWNAPEETAHAIRDGWLYTGDIGRVDEFGWLFVIDRKKDLINAGGYKVWPRDVEDVLYQHPRVREAAVVGVDDEYRGETVKAFVALTPGDDVTEGELIEFCKERISAYKYPRIVEIVADIPKTASGKLMRRALRPVPPQTEAAR